MEEWRTIPSAPAYEASSLGRIRRAKSATGTKVGRVRKLHTRKSGYVDVNLSEGNVSRTRMVHTLVCEAFHGPRPSQKHEPAHANGRRGDNRSSNLSWATHLENEQHKAVHGTLRRGASHYKAKLTVRRVRAIRRRAENGERPAVIARDLSLDLKHVCKVIKRQVWAHVQ